MRVIITGRHVKVTGALRRYIETRVKRLYRYGVTLRDVQVVVGVEEYRHIAEVILTFNGVVIQGKASTNEMYSSIDQVLEKISTQVRKRKERRIRHKPTNHSLRQARRREETEAEPVALTTVRVPLHTLTVEEAIGYLSEQPSAVFLFADPISNRVQVMRRLDNGGIELIDPQPVSHGQS